MEAPSATSTRPANRPERPCDTCRKRKSKCAKAPGQDRCILCEFHDRACTYQDAHQQRRKRDVASPQTVDSATPPRKRSKATAEPPAPSLLDRTLGLHRTTHFKHIGSSSPQQEKLIDILHQVDGSGDCATETKFRRVAHHVTFLSRSDNDIRFDADVDQDLEEIEALMRPHGRGLVHLYFRIVHPSYPILNEDVFLEKYERSYTEFSPPLLAAVYLLAMDWWEFDRILSSHSQPDANALSRLATKALIGDIQRPKLSSVQAGLLLLQRMGGDSWVLASQVVALGEELGLHLDCTDWDIPDWEKGLRRRLAWALLMQDKWGSLIHGRPSHISLANWRLSAITLDDFPGSAVDDDETEGSSEVEQGRLLFIHLTRLTMIMIQALESLYGPDDTVIQDIVKSQGVQGLLELVKPLVVQLKAWAHSLPAALRMHNVKTRKLCSNGYLHLSYFVTEIIIHRHIVGNLDAAPLPLLTLCRDAGRARLERAIAFVDGLKPEHLQAFWWFAAPKCLAYIRTYGGLLWATSATPEEAGFYRKKLQDFRWGLKVRAKGVGFVTAALKEMEESLSEIDMSRGPIMTGAGDGESLFGEIRRSGDDTDEAFNVSEDQEFHPSLLGPGLVEISECGVDYFLSGAVEPLG
ncbi:fungal-specific transcription factor domain-containing protein [Triangularia verruculosa]|uniref:Fungal-specific transcription factor domain-containing protein n=1 Tax=Triangularia verruculosa TaxID=2587418 RepID=A0AAN6X7H8_9PEZI|nr:fungal-specific transcription factor domain-containing protein [Triangularia verruculosa]